MIDTRRKCDIFALKYFLNENMCFISVRGMDVLCGLYL